MSGVSADAFVGLGLLTLLAAAALGDLRHRRIDNRICAALLALWPAYLVVTPAPVPILAGLGVGTAVLVVAVVLWHRRLIGGGDAKLLAVLAVWAGPGRVVPFLLVTAVAGGALALAWLWHRRIGWTLLVPFHAALAGRLPSWLAASSAGRPAGLPYGVAIAIGGGWLWLRLFAA